MSLFLFVLYILLIILAFPFMGSAWVIGSLSFVGFIIYIVWRVESAVKAIRKRRLGLMQRRPWK